MWPKGLQAFFIAFLTFTISVAQEDKTYNAGRFDVDVSVSEDGTLLVEETVDFNFVGGPFTFVFRELLLEKTDGIVDIVAGLDGRSLTPGNAPGQVEIVKGDPIRITWHLAPTANAAHTFDLSYRVLGVVRQEPEADLLTWQALPDDYDYPIAASTITFTYPRTAALSGPPVIEHGSAGITVEDRQIRFNTGPLEPGEILIVSLPFETGSLISSPPEWQTNQREQTRWALIWAGISVLVFVTGLAGLYVVRRPYRRPSPKPSTMVYELPAEYPPAMVGLLRHGGAKPGWHNALGTLFDLAGRGIMIIEEIPKKGRFSSPDFLIRLLKKPTDLLPHERGLLDLLFESGSNQTKMGGPQFVSDADQVKLSKLNKLITSSRWDEYAESLQAEMKAAFLIDPTRQAFKKRITTRSLVIGLLLIAASLALTLLLNQVFGYWMLILVAALFLLMLIWIIGAASISELSDDGASLAAEWEPFYQYLKAVTRGKASATNPDMFEQYLPYAAAYGLLADWAKRFEKKGWTRVPAYFEAMNTTGGEGMAAFVLMASASSTSGGASTVATSTVTGASAAGGGASGAG